MTADLIHRLNKVPVHMRYPYMHKKAFLTEIRQRCGIKRALGELNVMKKLPRKLVIPSTTAVLRIHDISVRIRLLTYLTDPDLEPDPTIFRHWPSRQQKTNGN